LYLYFPDIFRRIESYVRAVEFEGIG
jgi:hypothetical protein